MPDVDMTRSTWPDVGRHRGQKMAAIQTGSGNTRCRATLGHVVSGISESGVVVNVGVDVEIASPSLSVQTLFLLPVCVVTILRFPCRPTSGHVVSGIPESGMDENVGGGRLNRVAISFRSKVFYTSGLRRRHFAFPMSADVGPCRQWHT